MDTMNEPEPGSTPAVSGLGHNLSDLTLRVELRLFNRIQRLVGKGPHRRLLDVPAGTAVGDLLERLAIPADEIFTAFGPGRDISAAPGTDYALDEDDVLALSGAVPYGRGYGAPVV